MALKGKSSQVEQSTIKPRFKFDFKAARGPVLQHMVIKHSHPSSVEGDYPKPHQEADANEFKLDDHRGRVTEVTIHITQLNTHDFQRLAAELRLFENIRVLRIVYKGRDPLAEFEKRNPKHQLEKAQDVLDFVKLLQPALKQLYEFSVKRDAPDQHYTMVPHNLFPTMQNIVRRIGWLAQLVTELNTVARYPALKKLNLSQNDLDCGISLAPLIKAFDRHRMQEIDLSSNAARLPEHMGITTPDENFDSLLAKMTSQKSLRILHNAGNKSYLDGRSKFWEALQQTNLVYLDAEVNDAKVETQQFVKLQIYCPKSSASDNNKLLEAARQTCDKNLALCPRGFSTGSASSVEILIIAKNCTIQLNHALNAAKALTKQVSPAQYALELEPAAATSNLSATATSMKAVARYDGVN